MSDGRITPPRRGDHGQRGLARSAQVAVDDLSLDLERDQEEEQGHQAVVDPVAEVLVDREIADPDVELRVPERLVSGDAEDVHPDQRDDRPGEQRESPARLGLEEVGDRIEHPE